MGHLREVLPNAVTIVTMEINQLSDDRR